MSANPTSTLALIQSGIILGVTLSWADVVRTGASYIYPNDKEKILEAQIVYASILTILVVIMFYFLQISSNVLSNIGTNVDKKIIYLNPHLFQKVSSKQTS